MEKPRTEFSPPSSSHSPVLLLLAASPPSRRQDIQGPIQDPPSSSSSYVEASFPLFLLSASALRFPPYFTEITGSPIPKAPWGQKTSLNIPSYPPSRTEPRTRIHHCPHGGHSTLDTSSGFTIAHSGGVGRPLQLQPLVLRGTKEVEKRVTGPNSREGTQALNALRPASLKSYPRPEPCHPEGPGSEPPAGSHLQAPRWTWA